MEQQLCKGCGNPFSAADHFCRTCGYKLFQVMRSENEIKAEMENLKKLPINDIIFLSLSLHAFEALAWVLGDNNMAPSTLIEQSLQRIERSRHDGHDNPPFGR